jgi:hypothetical protein
LGYTLDESSIVIPDATALLGRWNIEARKKPELQPLRIAPVDGIIKNIKFISEILTHDVIISSNREFVHDNLIHCVPTLLAKWYYPIKYEEIKAHNAMLLSKVFDPVIKSENKTTEMAVFIKLLGIAVDTLIPPANSAYLDGLKMTDLDALKKFVKGFVIDAQRQSSLQKSYGTVDHDRILQIMDRFLTIQKETVER